MITENKIEDFVNRTEFIHEIDTFLFIIQEFWGHWWKEVGSVVMGMVL